MLEPSTLGVVVPLARPERALSLIVAVALVSLAGCASGPLPDAMAETIIATRPSTVASGEALAKTSARLPATFDQLNAILGEAARTSHEAREAEGELARSVEQVVASIHSGAMAAARILDDAQKDGADTRTDRAQIVHNVEQVTASLERLLASTEARSHELMDQQARAAKALADLTEASARTAKALAELTEASARTAARAEPDLAKASSSTASILADVAKITGRLAADDSGRTAAMWAAAGGLAGVVAFGLVLLGIRAVFQRAVVAATSERLKHPPFGRGDA